MELKVLLWNVQDLFIFMDKYQGEDLSLISEPKWQLLTTSLKNNKELNKVKGLAECINRQSPDLLFLTEVGGKESLDNFNTYFLDDEYLIYHHASNSDRGIDVGILYKKNLKLISQFKFHKHKVFAFGHFQIPRLYVCRYGLTVSIIPNFLLVR